MKKLEAQRMRARRMQRVNRERSDAALSDRKLYVTSAGKSAFAGYDASGREAGL